MVGNKRKSIGLGSYPEVLLAAAKEKARATKEMIVDGTDPIAEKRAKRAALKKEMMSTSTLA